MTDNIVVIIRVDGGPVPGGVLDQMMREQGVQVQYRSGSPENRSWQSIVEATAAIADLTVLVVQGGRPAIRAALDTFRKRFPNAMAEVDGEPDDGGFLDG